MKGLLEKICKNKETLSQLLQIPNNKKIMDKWLKTELAYTSNAIEGNTLTRKETALVIEENLTSSPKPINDYLEARNHAKAYEYIISNIDQSLPITENTILQIHKIILLGIDDMNAGFYRAVRVRISGSQVVLPNPLKVPALMEEFAQWLAQKKDSPILEALEAHYKLVTIHPFVDGNGRTARLLMNMILLHSGFAPIIIRPIDRKRYLTALETRQLGGNEDGYITFMLTALNRSLKTIIGLLDTENTTDTPTSELMTISKFAKFMGVPVSTIRYWMEIGKIKPISYTAAGYALFSPDQKEE